MVALKIAEQALKLNEPEQWFIPEYSLAIGKGPVVLLIGGSKGRDPCALGNLTNKNEGKNQMRSRTF